MHKVDPHLSLCSYARVGQWKSKMHFFQAGTVDPLKTKQKTRPKSKPEKNNPTNSKTVSLNWSLWDVWHSSDIGQGNQHHLCVRSLLKEELYKMGLSGVCTHAHFPTHLLNDVQVQVFLPLRKNYGLKLIN